MKLRRAIAFAALLGVGIFSAGSLTSALAQGGTEPTTPTGSSAALVFGEQRTSIPISFFPAGVLFAVEPLTARLGGSLELGAYREGYTLKLLDEDFLFGPESPSLTVGEDIQRLSQPPQMTPEGLKVPLDFLELTFGRVFGYRLAWERSSLTLAIQRQATGDLFVQPELMHLRGITTLVFEFPNPPRYRLETLPGLIDIEILQGRLVHDWQPRQDSFVRRITLQADRIRVELAPGVSADHYVVENPFRLVFDIHPALAASAEAPQKLKPPRRRQGVRTIVLDPGHGGTESGAVGPSGILEKDLTLMLARRLKQELEQRMPVQVILTRGEDANLPLETRTAIANENKADLFISLHLNSSYGAQAHGAETYILNLKASDPQAAGAAAAENQAGSGAAASAGDPLYDLQLILWDMAQSHSLSESNRFASLVQDELNGALELRDRGVKQAPFRVLMGAGMPAVLVELGFLSNPREEAKLKDAEYRAQLVQALARAVVRYRNRLSSQDRSVAGTAHEEATGEPGR